MKKQSLLALSLGAVLMSACSGKAASTAEAQSPAEDSIPVVYYIKDITPENLVKIYNALPVKAEGKNVAVKISTGESEKSNQLSPALIEPLVKLVNGTIVECNTAYEGNRRHTADHLKTAERHGYTAIANVDIMDADGDTAIVVNGGKHLPYDIVGKHWLDYDYTVVLSHFKGHQMGGFGGALKNISIGIASADGKAWIHSAGKTRDANEIWGNTAEQDDFIESMAEASKAIVDHADGKILFINVANNLSVDCDCNGDPAKPEIGDLGIFASTDPVALDKACVDMVFNLDDPKKAALIERIKSRHGLGILDHGEALGIGSQKYRLVEIK